MARYINVRAILEEKFKGNSNNALSFQYRMFGQSQKEKG